MLCTGQSLLPIDALDDNLADFAQVEKLKAWRGLNPAGTTLAKAFVAAGGACWS